MCWGIICFSCICRAIVLKELDERLASGAVSSDNYAFFVAAATIYCFEEVRRSRTSILIPVCGRGTVI